MLAPMATSMRIDPSQATAQQLLLAVHESQLRLEKKMSELSTAVTELQGAVDGVAERLLPKIEALESANATLESSLADALADDEAAAAAFEEAKQATADIRAQADELNSLGQNPETPIDPDAPHVDNSLPGPQPEINPL